MNPTKNMNIADYFSKNALEHPDFPALELDNHSCSYSQLRNAAEGMARHLLLQGYQPGDIIGLRLGTPVQYCALIWALALCGCVVFPIRTNATRSEIRTAIAGIPLKAVIALSVKHAIPNIETIILGDLEKPLEASGTEVSWPEVSPSAPFKMCQTSGSTGKPKTFVFSHSQIIKISRQSYGSEMQWSQGDRLFFAHEMADTWGSEMVIAAMYAGATIVLGSSNSTAEYIEYIQQKKITLCGMGPHRMRQLLEHAGDKFNQFPDMKFLEAGTAVLFPEERELFHQCFTPNVYNCYDTTEVPSISWSRPDDLKLHPNSVGQLCPGVEAEIVDDDHNPVACGVTGLLRVRSDNMLSEYYQNPEASLKHFKDGWFYPLDHAYITEDGYLYLQGRADDVINSRGAKFYPAELESTIRSFPGIVDVAVFSWPDEIKGQVAVAAISTKSKPNLEKLHSFCTKRLGSVKTPKYFMVTGSIPRTPANKADLNALKKLFKKKIDQGK